MEFITTNTKKNVKITPASMRECTALKRVVMKIASGSDILKEIKANSINKLGITGMLTGIIQGIIELDSSEEFEKALMACLRKCIYDDKFSITEQLFDDKPEIREDYYEIASKCCEVNLRPFLKSLVSELKTRLNQPEVNTPELQ